MDILIAYATTDGMTARIAERIAEAVRTAGAHADVVDTAQAPKGLDPSAYDAIMVGASMHAQGYQHAIKRFLRRNLHVLRARPTAFWSVCLAICSKNAEERAAARKIPEEFVQKMGWRPDAVEPIAGALMFSRYGLLRRWALIRIARKEMGSVDPARDTVFTDWEAVDHFAQEFVALVARKTAVRSPALRSAAALSGPVASPPP